MFPKIYTIMFWFSISLSLAAGILLFIYGLNFGVDFRGGSVMELEFTEGRPDISDIKQVVNIPNSSVSSFEERGVIIRAGELTEEEHQAFLHNLGVIFPEAGMVEHRFESIGPVIGEELKDKSIRAIIIVLLAISFYISVVFRRLSGVVPGWLMASAAIVSLFHDLLIPMGIFAVLGHFYGVEISAVFVAAVLTILGYSVADTVVIFDRVRENVGRNPKNDFGATVHKSVLQTLTRSINTTLTTLLALIAIYFFGGESIKYFSLALILGIFFGAYSSIFIASPLLVWGWQRFRRFDREVE